MPRGLRQKERDIEELQAPLRSFMLQRSSLLVGKWYVKDISKIEQLSNHHALQSFDWHGGLRWRPVHREGSSLLLGIGIGQFHPPLSTLFSTTELYGLWDLKTEDTLVS